jgi:precorrin-6A/cobalt-precorrin-6A reductase
VEPLRVLLLAGTAEATRLATLLAERPGVAVLASLAGHTRTPAALPCPVRVGGFGGVDGLVGALREGGYGAVVDATHPFAAVMPHHAAAAAEEAGVHRVRLLRPAWRPQPGDDWHEVADLAGAASTVVALGARRVLLTTGRLSLGPFAGVAGVHLVVRSIEPPDPPLPGAISLLARGPFTVDGEVALLREHRIDAVVTKNSGGRATAAKLAAARRIGLPVVMVRRPPAPAGPVVDAPEAAVRWLDSLPTAARPAR